MRRLGRSLRWDQRRRSEGRGGRTEDGEEAGGERVGLGGWLVCVERRGRGGETEREHGIVVRLKGRSRREFENSDVSCWSKLGSKLVLLGVVSSFFGSALRPGSTQAKLKLIKS